EAVNTGGQGKLQVSQLAIQAALVNAVKELDTNLSTLTSSGSSASGSFGTGNVLALGDARYLRLLGGSLSGSLSVAGDVYALSFHAASLLSSSGALRVSGAARFGSGVTIAARTTASSATLLTIKSDVAVPGDTVFRITADGNAYADGAFTGGGADYAEWFLA